MVAKCWVLRRFRVFFGRASAPQASTSGLVIHPDGDSGWRQREDAEVTEVATGPSVGHHVGRGQLAE